MEQGCSSVTVLLEIEKTSITKSIVFFVLSPTKRFTNPSPNIYSPDVLHSRTELECVYVLHKE